MTAIFRVIEARHGAVLTDDVYPRYSAQAGGYMSCRVCIRASAPAPWIYPLPGPQLQQSIRCDDLKRQLQDNDSAWFGSRGENVYGNSPVHYYCIC